MRNEYFSINECTEKELEQLRWALFYEDVFDKNDFTIFEECTTPDEIPFELLEKAYGHINFVDEDFWCNCEDELEDLYGDELEEVRLEQNGGII